MNRHLLLVASFFLIASCKQPLASLQGQEITQITVVPLQYGMLEGHKISVISDRGDIRFIVRSLSDLKARRYDHSQPDFDLLMLTSSGSHLKVRVSGLEVGPDAPASTSNTHWFPRDAHAYKEFWEFLFQKTLPKP